MARFRARIDQVATKALLKRVADIKSPLTKADTEKMGREVVLEMKRLIAKGESPITGPGIPTRFPPYKNPKRYPGNRKPHRPVNLKLTGAFLRALNFRSFQLSRRWFSSVGFDAAREQKKELGHREGAKGQPKRPIIPNPSQGEKFKRKIQEKILDVARMSVRRVVRGRK